MSEVITKQKILIADDSEMNRELLAAILEEEYDIIQVNDGVQAVDCLQRQAEEISLLLSGYCYAPHGWFRGSFLYE